MADELQNYKCQLQQVSIRVERILYARSNVLPFVCIPIYKTIYKFCFLTYTHMCIHIYVCTYMLIKLQNNL